MRVEGEQRRSLQRADDGAAVEVIDQTRLPFALVLRRLETLDDAAEAIRSMRVRGAPLIGVTAAYGLAFALRDDASDAALESACQTLLATRPTAVNLAWALADVRAALAGVPPAERARLALNRADRLAEAEVASCRAIAGHGLPLLEATARRAGPRALQLMTHCNAGWLACVDWGTALAPVYLAHERGIDLHVWVSETRPRNQGASLTAWELAQQGVPHTLVVDSAAGHLMQRGCVDLCLTGTDRTTRTGDVCNKIGTYPKALLAREHGLPFYVAAPSSSIDWTVDDGVAGIPIEERSSDEVTRVWGRCETGRCASVQSAPDASPAHNPAFDVTPARLVSGLITERGVCAASLEGLLGLFPERRSE